MSTQSPVPHPLLTDEEDADLRRAIAATINYHAFDTSSEMADFDMADAIMDTNLAASSAGVATTVANIVAQREAAAHAEGVRQGHAEAREGIAAAIRGREVHLHRSETDLNDCTDGCGWLNWTARLAEGWQPGEGDES